VRRFIPLTIALMFVAGTALAEGPELVPDEQTFFLHWDECGADIHTYLSIQEPPPGGNGCGFIGGTPVNTPLVLLGEPLIDTYSAEDGIPVKLDGSGEITGEVAVWSWTGVTGAGVGLVVIEGQLTGMANGQFQNFGTYEGEVLATPADDYVSVEFAFEVPDALNEANLTSLSLDVNVWGAYADSGVHTAGGISSVTLPILVEAEETD
jgi:hypothetical protein